MLSEEVLQPGSHMRSSSFCVEVLRVVFSSPCSYRVYLAMDLCKYLRVRPAPGTFLLGGISANTTGKSSEHCLYSLVYCCAGSRVARLMREMKYFRLLHTRVSAVLSEQKSWKDEYSPLP